MPESFATRKFRWFWNFFPAYRGTGARVLYISADWKDVRIKLPLSWRSRNYVGTIFGGSLYASVDPIYMLMLMNILGRDYVVWDKAAKIRFRKPGKTTLYANFVFTDDELSLIRREAENQNSIDRIYNVNLCDADGTVHVEIEKTLFIAERQKFEKRR